MTTRTRVKRYKIYMGNEKPNVYNVSIFENGQYPNLKEILSVQENKKMIEYEIKRVVKHLLEEIMHSGAEIKKISISLKCSESGNEYICIQLIYTISEECYAKNESFV
jgi:hypothetical protein